MRPESELHFIWMNRLFRQVTLEGEPIEVLDVGELNSHDGPDFALSRVRVGHIEWVGSVEIHRRASEWEAHKHQHDPRYCSVVLHVVLEADREVCDQEGRRVPTAVLEMAPEMLEYLERLVQGNKSLRCMPEMMALGEEPFLDGALELLPERLEEKLARLRDRSESDHFNSILYHTLMRYVGAHQNNEVMQQVAESLPYTYLKKHASDLVALEAMLIGQAGLLSETPRDEYEAKLLEEYRFYQQKFGLIPLPAGSFRYLRLRPSSFPARMLGIVAMILHHEELLLSALSRLDKPIIEQTLRLAPSPYWQEHFDFGRRLDVRRAGVGRQTLTSLIINAIVPSAYYYAQKVGDAHLEQRALDWLFLLQPEQNQYVKLFVQNGLHPRHAADTQALLQLYHHYCQPLHCLRCPLAIAYFHHCHHR